MASGAVAPKSLLQIGRSTSQALARTGLGLEVDVLVGVPTPEVPDADAAARICAMLSCEKNSAGELTPAFALTNPSIAAPGCQEWRRATGAFPVTVARVN